MDWLIIILIAVGIALPIGIINIFITSLCGRKARLEKEATERRLLDMINLLLEVKGLETIKVKSVEEQK